MSCKDFPDLFGTKMFTIVFTKVGIITLHYTNIFPVFASLFVPKLSLPSAFLTNIQCPIILLRATAHTDFILFNIWPITLWTLHAERRHWIKRRLTFPMSHGYSRSVAGTTFPEIFSTGVPVSVHPKFRWIDEKFMHTYSSQLWLFLVQYSRGRGADETTELQQILFTPSGHSWVTCEDLTLGEGVPP